tara:strand:+ start:509 stop:853 length:345 start_codon:yes stop_codon:yes gene_type:complete
MYPQIRVLSQDIPQFVVELRPSDDPSTWEVYYHGNSKKDAIKVITQLLQREQTAFLTADKGGNLQGYIFQIRSPDKLSRFFKATEDVKNPFYNRKVYENMEPNSVASFHAIGFE